MKEPPYVEVVFSAGPAAEVGQRFPFSGVLGRVPTCDVQLQVGTISHQHCRFIVEKGRMFVEDCRTTNGTFLNGVMRSDKAEVSPGDWIEVPWGFVLRVGGGPPFGIDEADELARSVLEAPEEDGRWRVWADALLERGNPLGERIARGRGADVAEDAKALGPLARELVDGSFEVEWRHGFIRRAVLRNRSQWPPSMWIVPLRMLLEHPLARFIEEIEVDALSYTRGGDRDDVVTHIVHSLELVAKAKPFPLLHSVRFGPSPRVLWNPQLEGAWNRATATHPKLRTGPIWVARAAWLQLLATPPGVTVAGLELGAQRKLMEDGANLVGPIDDCAFVLDAPQGSPSSQVALRIDRENGLWVAEDMAADHPRRNELPLYVNGRRCTHHRMRPQDLLEPAPGLLFRFVME